MLKQRVLPEIREDGGGGGADDSGDGPVDAPPTHETVAARRQRTDADAQWRRRLAYVLSPLAFLTLLLLLDALRRRAHAATRAATHVNAARCVSSARLTPDTAALAAFSPPLTHHHGFT
jgi:hypothetical protein